MTRVIWYENTVFFSGRPEKERTVSREASFSSDMSLSYRRPYRKSRMATPGAGASQEIKMVSCGRLEAAGYGLQALPLPHAASPGRRGDS